MFGMRHPIRRSDAGQVEADDTVEAGGSEMSGPVRSSSGGPGRGEGTVLLLAAFTSTSASGDAARSAAAPRA